MSDSKPIDKKAEVHFLVDNFGIIPNPAAEMIEADATAAEALAFEVLVEDHAKDPLAEVPVPSSNADPKHVEQGIEDMEKPVVHSDSAPT